MATSKKLQQTLKRQLEASEAQVEQFFNQLKNFLDVALDEVADAVGDGTSTAEVARVLGGLRSALIEAGFYDRVAELDVIYGDEMRRIAQAWKESTGQELIYSSIDLDITEALINFDTQAVTSRLDQYVDNVRATVMRNVVAGQTPDFEAVRDVTGERVFSNLKTEFNTLMQGFNRSVNQKKADDAGFELFLYIGPDDDITRDFCAERVNQVFTKEEIDSWDNGQGLPAATYLGGYNCRHQLRPVSLELAREYGYEG